VQASSDRIAAATASAAAREETELQILVEVSPAPWSGVLCGRDADEHLLARLGD